MLTWDKRKSIGPAAYPRCALNKSPWRSVSEVLQKFFLFVVGQALLGPQEKAPIVTFPPVFYFCSARIDQICSYEKKCKVNCVTTFIRTSSHTYDFLQNIAAKLYRFQMYCPLFIVVGCFDAWFWSLKPVFFLQATVFKEEFVWLLQDYLSLLRTAVPMRQHFTRLLCLCGRQWLYVFLWKYLLNKYVADFTSSPKTCFRFHEFFRVIDCTICSLVNWLPSTSIFHIR